MTTDQLVTTLRDRSIDPAVTLDLFAQWLESTAVDLRKKRRYNDAEYLVDKLHNYGFGAS